MIFVLFCILHFSTILNKTKYTKKDTNTGGADGSETAIEYQSLLLSRGETSKHCVSFFLHCRGSIVYSNVNSLIQSLCEGQGSDFLKCIFPAALASNMNCLIELFIFNWFKSPRTVEYFFL